MQEIKLNSNLAECVAIGDDSLWGFYKWIKPLSPGLTEIHMD